MTEPSMTEASAILREKLERNVIEHHVARRADMRSRGAIFNDQLEGFLADELRREMAKIDEMMPYMGEYIQLISNFHKRYERDPKPEEADRILADAKMLAA